MPNHNLTSDFLKYLATLENVPGDCAQLPSLGELSAELEVSVSKLREQLEVGRALGLVEVRPRTGIRRMPYRFFPAVQQSLLYAIALDWRYFDAFADLRKNVEAAYWQQAVDRLGPVDFETLQELMSQAWEKLNGTPIIIPHEEHRQLHLTIYKNLENPFVSGILEAYWEAYEAVGLNLYADYEYLQEVWTYHQKMVDSILSGDMEAGYQAFLEHSDLLHHRPGS